MTEEKNYGVDDDDDEVLAEQEAEVDQSFLNAHIQEFSDNHLDLSGFQRAPANTQSKETELDERPLVSDAQLGLYQFEPNPKAKQKFKQSTLLGKRKADVQTSWTQKAKQRVTQPNTTEEAFETFLSGDTTFGFNPNTKAGFGPRGKGHGNGKGKKKAAAAWAISPDLDGEVMDDDVDEDTVLDVRADEYVPYIMDQMLSEDKQPDFCYDCEYGKPEEEDQEEMDSLMVDGLDSGSKPNVSKMAFLGIKPGTQRETMHKKRMSMYRRNKKKMYLSALCEHMYQDYKNNIQHTLVDHKSIDGKSNPCPEMLKATVYRHIMGIGGHRRSEKAQDESQIELFQNILAELRMKGCFKKDRNKLGETMIDKDHCKLAILVSKHLCEIKRTLAQTRKAAASGRGVVKAN